MLINQNIIYFSSARWDGLWTRKQRFMDMLADYCNRILFVEVVNSIWTKFMNPDANISLRFKHSLRQVKKDLFVLTPPLLLPGAHSRVGMSNSVNQYILRKFVKKYQERLALRDPIIWTSDVAAVKSFPFFSAKARIYDCTDEGAYFPNVNKSYFQKMENELLKMSDIVIVTAKELLERKCKINKRTFWIPNGVDFDHFARAHNLDLERPSEMVDIHKPVAGFIGKIASWIDLELIGYLSDMLPDWSFVIIGPISQGLKGINELRRKRNIYFLGRKDSRILPNYVRCFDICIAPFKMNRLVETVSPLKVYEYLATGKPVVSTPLPELIAYQDIIYLARTKNEFLEKIQIAKDRDTREMVHQRMKIANEHNWTKLLEALSSIIEKYIDGEI